MHVWPGANTKLPLFPTLGDEFLGHGNGSVQGITVNAREQETIWYK